MPLLLFSCINVSDELRMIQKGLSEQELRRDPNGKKTERNYD